MRKTRTRLRERVVSTKPTRNERRLFGVSAAVLFGAIVAAGASNPIPFDRISTSTANAQGGASSAFSLDDTAKHPLSWDGQNVVFESAATNLVVGDTNAVSEVFAKNFNTSASAGVGACVRVSVADNEAQADAISMHGAINSNSDGNDGRFVVFSSPATNLTDDNGDGTFNDDTNGVMDIFIRDRDADQDGITTRPALPAPLVE